MSDDDYLGRDLSSGQIEALASSLRTIAGLEHSARLSIFYAVENNFSRIFPQFALVPRSRDEMHSHKALTSYDPPRIEIREDIYIAGDRSSVAKYIIAHELGHVVMHREMPRSLKNAKQERKLLANAHNLSTEWQADEFALHFLVPRRLALRLGSLEAIVNECGVPYWIALRASRRYELRSKRRLLPYEVKALQDGEDDFT